MRHFLTAICISILALDINSQVTLQSTLPATIGINSEFNFDVKITKGSVANFSKYQIDVPAGITIKEVESKAGSFSFENNRAKIIWVNTPAESEFILTMKLISGSGNTPATINQKFTFLENGAKKEVEAEPLAIVFSGSGSSNPVKISNSAPSNETSAKTATLNASKNTITEKAPVSTTKQPLTGQIPDKKAETETLKAPERKEVNETAASTISSTGSIVYKVQLAASADKPLASKYASLSQVNIVKEGAMYKVLIGSFPVKEDAVKMKTDLAAKGFNGFVVAYQNGERVK